VILPPLQPALRTKSQSARLVHAHGSDLVALVFKNDSPRWMFTHGAEREKPS